MKINFTKYLLKLCFLSLITINIKFNIHAFSFDPNIKAFPGQGLSTKINDFRYACIAQDTQSLAYSGNSSTEGKFYYNQDKSSIINMNTLTATGRVGVVDLAEGEAQVSLAQLLSSDDENLNIIYQFDISGVSAVVNNPKLTPFGQSALKESPEKILALCGDSFIGAIDLGAKFYINLKAHFSNAEKKRTLTEKISVSVLWGSVTVEHTEFDDDVKKNLFLSIEAYQFGGHKKVLENILSTNPIMGCSLDNLEPCRKVMLTLLSYATGKNIDGTEYPNNFIAQLNHMKYSKEENIGPNVVNYIAAHYENWNFIELDQHRTIDLDLAKNQAIKIKKQELQDAYDAQENKIIRISALKNAPNIEMRPEQSIQEKFNSYKTIMQINANNI